MAAVRPARNSIDIVPAPGELLPAYAIPTCESVKRIRSRFGTVRTHSNRITQTCTALPIKWARTAPLEVALAAHFTPTHLVLCESSADRHDNLTSSHGDKVCLGRLSSSM